MMPVMHFESGILYERERMAYQKSCIVIDEIFALMN